MGQGIDGVLPLKLVESKKVSHGGPRVLPGLLDCYEIIDENDKERIYGIKANIFFSEFREYHLKLQSIFDNEDIMGPSWINDKWDKFDEIAKTGSIKNFVDFWGGGTIVKNNGEKPPHVYGRGFASTYTLGIGDHISE
jgi:hypothetical protein